MLSYDLHNLHFDWRTALVAVVTLAHLLYLLFDKRRNYVSVYNDSIRVYGLFTRKIKRDQFLEVVEDSRYITLRGNQKTIKINKNLIAEVDIGKTVFLKHE